MKIKHNYPRLLATLDVLKFFLVLMMVIMFIGFNAKVAREQTQTAEIAKNTNNVVKSQQDILAAIKQVTDDTHTTAAQQTAIIICMLQVPIENRTTDLQQECRDKSNAAAANSGAQTGENSTNINPVGPSSNSTPDTGSSQSNSSQNPPSGGSDQPGFFQRNIVQPIKNLINAL